MSAEDLVKKIIEYGADADGIRDRFGDNFELYQRCFEDFLDDLNFSVLENALKEKDYKKAFEAAHALKGMSGNLGITAFYDACCILVEALRNEQFDNLTAQYAALRVSYQLLRNHLSKDAPTQENTPVTGEAEAQGRRKVADKRIMLSLLAAIAALCMVSLFFCRISIDYRDNVLKESGQHLTNMSNQIRLYLEEHMANDWRIAESVGGSIMDENYEMTDENVIGRLEQRQKIWGVSSLILYTENGYCVYSDGTTQANDIASETIARAREKGKHMSVVKSNIIYTVPITLPVHYRASRVAAVSVVRDMSTFLDDMNLSYYDADAWMYLTDENGVVVSMLSQSSSETVFNFKAILKENKIESLDDSVADNDVMTAQQSAPFLMDNGEKKYYVVSIPIATGAQPLRLFYLEAEECVNQTMNGFSSRLTAFSILMIVLFAFCIITIFAFMYHTKKRAFDKAITARERMFDLLVKNTRTAFALFDVTKPNPSYVSSNAGDIVGDEKWRVIKDESGYRLQNKLFEDTEMLKCVNKDFCKWDGKSVFKSGYILNNASATPYYFEFQLYPVDDEGLEFVGIAQDVTASYEREEVTKNAMEMAKRSDKAKSQFLSNMSHDIRTPMNAIMNMTNFALESVDNPKKLGTYLHTIRESSEHLLHLINDVLDVSRIESGQAVINSAPFNIKAEIQRQVDIIKPLCVSKKQTLITDFEGIRTDAVCGDSLKLSQIIMNLLSNAVKFTPEKGAVRLTVREIPSLREDIADIRIIIEDTGIGISSENLKHIFEPFCRAKDKRVSKIEGSGLGLSICKSYVEAMGGRIRCESEESEGTVFTVELFFEKVDMQSLADLNEAVRSETPFVGMRALVAEDNTVNQVIAREMLERLGFIVDIAEDGSECVKVFLKSNPDTYDVIYMDIQMPVLDGYQAAMKIRTSSHARAKTIPIIAMTANAFAEDIEKARVAGMDAYVGKPIVTFDLIEQTNKAINKKRG